MKIVVLPILFLAAMGSVACSAGSHLDRSGYVGACTGGDRLAGTEWRSGVSVVEFLESTTGADKLSTVARRGGRCAGVLDMVACQQSWEKALGAAKTQQSEFDGLSGCGGDGCTTIDRRVIVEEDGVAALLLTLTAVRAKQAKLTPANAAFLVAKGAPDFCKLGTKAGSSGGIDVLYTQSGPCGAVVTRLYTVSEGGNVSEKDAETDEEGYTCV